LIVIKMAVENAPSKMGDAMRRLTLLAFATAQLVIGAQPHAQTAGYPARPITVVVPAAAGGPTDTLSRILAERMAAYLHQPLVIENNGAAGGSIAVGRVARAAADGYTIGIGQYGHYVLNGAIYQLPYDLLNDFEPVALIASNPQLIVARTGMAAGNLKELIAWLKANPGKASQGTAGAGSPAHVSGLYFQRTTGTTFQFVPYRGAAPAMQDLLAGQIDLMFDQASNSLPQVRAGNVKAFAVTSAAHLKAAPEIPTVDEAGVPGFNISVWHGIWLPKGTPKEIVAKINAAAVTALADPRVRARLAELGQDIPPPDQQTPEVLGEFQKNEAKKWWPIVKAANIKAE
jgi:tripartite-type tricarboxylate transporter receptor subunit TctC